MKFVKNVPFAKSLKSGKRCIIKEIRLYYNNKNIYSITYMMPGNEFVKNTIKGKNMHEEFPRSNMKIHITHKKCVKSRKWRS